ncbi:MAG: dienelactone hydrolase family protein [Fimbriimonadaceae bacterium]|nr:dienelactone hydrolase family protein [Fimbriimonadaceae bacterium]
MTGFLEFAPELLNSVVYVPREFKSGMPAILFLHGAGESGEDGLRQLVHGPAKEAIRNRVTWPFLMVFPQKPTVASAWFDHRETINQLLAKVDREYATDPHRRYLTGLSQGGRGTMELATDLAWHFAAIAPVCGWNTRPGIGARLNEMPVWMFHGALDTLVPLKGSQDVEAEIRAAGGEPLLTVYDDVAHNAWDRAYADPELPKWFLSHSLD